MDKKSLDSKNPQDYIDAGHYGWGRWGAPKSKPASKPENNKAVLSPIERIGFAAIIAITVLILIGWGVAIYVMGSASLGG